MYLFAGLREVLIKYLSATEVEQITAAFLLSHDAHQGQQRTSGEPYITHPVAVARILAMMRMDAQTIMAALLHDVLEDTPMTRQQLVERFGEQVADLVEGVSKLTRFPFTTQAEAHAENLRKMMMAMVQDIRVILIKLADRLHNMRTLDALRPDKRRRIARETLEIYAPIAHRLGIYSVREELEDLGFAALYPVRYRILKAAVDKLRGHRKQVVSNIQQVFEQRIQSAQLIGYVQGREKHLFSIYRKMREKVGVFAQVTDIYGFRIITDSIDSCYRILGLMHNLYKPVPGRFKDYIAIPKSNGYQSLHTTLKGPRGLNIEVQVRTEEMDHLANHGIAAHWIYKGGKAPSNTAHIRAHEWMHQLLELQKSTGDSVEFIENVKIDLFPDEVYVFTPKGKIVELPVRATPVDFAYAIHTDVGNRCVAAKINDQLAPLTSTLRNGQTVEIITAPGARPNPAWLNFVISGKARANIRHVLKTQHHGEAVTLGQRMIEKILGVPIAQIPEERMRATLRNTRHKTMDDLWADVGLGNIAALVVAHRLQPDSDRKTATELDTVTHDKPLAIHGSEGLLIHYAKCCYPVPGDPIMGVVTSGRGIVIHHESCHNLGEHRKHADKYLPVQWEDHVSGEFVAAIRLDVANQRGVLAQLASHIADAEGNIVNIDIDERDGSFYTMTLLISVHHLEQLEKIMKKLRTIPAITRVARQG